MSMCWWISIYSGDSYIFIDDVLQFSWHAITYVVLLSLPIGQGIYTMSIGLFFLYTDYAWTGMVLYFYVNYENWKLCWYREERYFNYYDQIW